MTDAEGNPLYAVLRKDGDYETNDAGTYNIYPLYTALASMSGDVLDQVNLGGVDYYIIDAALSGGVLPVGTFSWDLNGLDYGWDGMNGNRKPSVTLNYQWGYSATQSQVIELDIPSKLVEYGYDDDDNPTLTVNGAKIAYYSWGEFKAKVGSLEGIEAYFKDTATTVSGAYVGGNVFESELSVVDWNVTALVKAAKSRAGSALSVNVTMYVGGAWNVWMEFQETDLLAEDWEFVRGFGGDFVVEIDGEWVSVTPDDIMDAESLVTKGTFTNNRGFVLNVAQPVTVTVTIGEQGDFEWTTPAAPGGDEVTPDTPDTYSFSDGSATALNGGVQTYEITTAAQLYGAMPESGSVVHPDGTTKRAAFDWNGFAYDTDSALNVARLSVTSGGDRIDTDVVVTLASHTGHRCRAQTPRHVHRPARLRHSRRLHRRHRASRAALRQGGQ